MALALFVRPITKKKTAPGKGTSNKKPLSSPEWAREKKIEDQFGLTHMILYSLRTAGEIRSVSLKAPGKKQGARLYHVGSIREYIARQEAMEGRAA